MTPQEFIDKWKRAGLTERASAQEHFIDLCRLFDHPTPAEDDPLGDHFTFEKGVPKTGGGEGYADVWKKGCFAWEYKKKKRDLDAALLQLAAYAAALENPPLHIACDTVRVKIVTAWTNEVPKTYEFELEDLAEPQNLRILRAVFHSPDELRSQRTRAALTKEAADRFQTISDRLQHRNPDREGVAHFVNQLVFCFFADSVKLLPEGLLKKLLMTAERRPQRAKEYFDKLFAEMERGGEFDLTDILHFNGGLFDGRRALPLEFGEIQLLIALTGLDWSLIDPTIFGTLFERFLDPDKRAQIGAHYTDPDKIMMIIEPVILRRLRAEWAQTKAEIEAIMLPALNGERGVGREGSRKLEKNFEAARGKAEVIRDRFIERLAKLRILDPACGSGNFLYLALQHVKDLELRAILESEELGLRRAVPRVGPEILHGIEINPLAAELARTTIWIGDIQWRIRNAIFNHPQPILRKLDTIEFRDALVTRLSSRLADRAEPPPPPSPAMGEGLVRYGEAEWPQAEFIVGNPPFLGIRLMRAGLGDEYVERLFQVYEGRVSREADFVTYWFEKARAALPAGRAKRVGLVATNSIRGGANRRVLDAIASETRIFEAWSDEPWIVEGAAVRVSLICFGQGDDPARLDGAAATCINADLTSGTVDLTKARRLAENLDVAFMGDTKGGAFDVSGALARAWLTAPLNPNGRPNSDVLRPWRNGLDITRRSRDKWIIDFGWEMSEREASLFEAPFQYAIESIKPFRISIQGRGYAKRWWIHERPRPEMWAAIATVKGYVATPALAKHRLFVQLDSKICPDHQLIVIARDDDVSFGILHSRFHEAWSLRLGTSLEDRPRYTPTTTFETFPFPEGLTPNIPAKDYADDPRALAIAEAARRLDELRNAWLNPPDLVRIEPEVVPGYPDRILPKDIEAAAVLRERTLTNLYNQRPQWLIDAHRDLDAAVAAAYGWPEDISTEDALERLMELNLARSSAQERVDRLSAGEDRHPASR